MNNHSAPEYVYQYHWGRIIAVAVIALLIVSGLLYWLTASSETEATPQVIATPVTEETPSTQQTLADTPSAPETNSITEKTTADQAAELPVKTKPGETDNPTPANKVSGEPPVEATVKVATKPIAPQDQEPQVAQAVQTAQPEPATTAAKAARFTDAIKRAKLTQSIRQHEPGAPLPAKITNEPNKLEKVYFYTEVIGEAGATHYHYWYHNGQLAAKVPIRIGSDRWRCYSSKYLSDKQTGQWQIKVNDAQGNLLAKGEFMFSPTP